MKPYYLLLYFILVFQNSFSQEEAYEKQLNRSHEIERMRVRPDGSVRSANELYSEWDRWLMNNRESGFLDYSWLPLGVDSWNAGSYGISPGNGRLNIIAVDPQDSLTLYVGSPTGGLWKTIDGGNSWSATFQNFAWLGVSSIAVDPGNSMHLFAGTGDRDGFVTTGGGLFESFDGGQSWSDAGFNEEELRVNKILFNPLNPEVIFAATNTGVFRSVNAGENWQHVYAGSEIKNLLYHPSDTSVLYGAASIFIRSDNGGTVFTDTTLGDNPVRLEIAVTPLNPDLLYVVEGNMASRFGALRRSLNTGLDFEIMSTTPNILGSSETGNSYDGQASYDLAICVSPSDENVILVGGINVWRSPDSGESWELSSEYHYDGGNDYTHADIHYFLNVENRVFCASDGGIFVSDNNGELWTDKSAGLNISEIYRLDVSSAFGERVLIGTQDNGTNLLEDGSWTHVYGADGQACLFDPLDTDTYYVSYQNGNLIRTTDNFGSYQMISPANNGAWTTPLVMNKSNPDEIYAAYTRVFRSQDAGENWDVISPHLAGEYSNLRILEVAPSDPDYIYAGVGMKLYVSKNAGQTWDTIALDGSILDMSVSDSDPEKIWLVTSYWEHALLESNDAGENFIDITNGLENIGLRCVESFAGYNGALFLGTENSVLYKDSLMDSWQALNSGFPSVYVRDMVIDKSANKLYAGTYGRGVWCTALPELVDSEQLLAESAYSVFPNPSVGVFYVSGLNNTAGVPDVYLLDESGRQLDVSIGRSGDSALKIEIQQKRKGHFYLLLINGDSREIIPVVVVV